MLCESVHGGARVRAFLADKAGTPRPAGRAPTGNGATAGDRYTTLAGGGLRIEHKAVRLDVGAMVLSEAWGRTDRVTEPGPWVALSAGF